MSDPGQQVAPIRRLTVVLPACDSRRHTTHPLVTCAEVDAEVTAVQQFIETAATKTFEDFMGPIAPAEEATDAVD